MLHLRQHLRKCSSESGSVFVLVLAGVALLMILGLGFMTASAVELRSGVSDARISEARETADAGLVHALSAIRTAEGVEADRIEADFDEFDDEMGARYEVDIEGPVSNIVTIRSRGIRGRTSVELTQVVELGGGGLVGFDDYSFYTGSDQRFKGNSRIWADDDGEGAMYIGGVVRDDGNVDAIDVRLLLINYELLGLKSLECLEDFGIYSLADLDEDPGEGWPDYVDDPEEEPREWYQALDPDADSIGDFQISGPFRITLDDGDVFDLNHPNDNFFTDNVWEAMRRGGVVPVDPEEVCINFIFEFFEDLVAGRDTDPSDVAEIVRRVEEQGEHEISDGIDFTSDPYSAGDKLPVYYVEGDIEIRDALGWKGVGAVVAGGSITIRHGMEIDDSDGKDYERDSILLVSLGKGDDDGIFVHPNVTHVDAYLVARGNVSAVQANPNSPVYGGIMAQGSADEVNWRIRYRKPLALGPIIGDRTIEGLGNGGPFSVNLLDWAVSD